MSARLAELLTDRPPLRLRHVDWISGPVDKHAAIDGVDAPSDSIGVCHAGDVHYQPQRRGIHGKG